MKSITSILVVVVVCAGCSACAGQDSFRRFIHGDPVVSGAPEINDNVFLLRNSGLDEDSYTDTGKVVPSPCGPFMRDPAPDETKDVQQLNDDLRSHPQDSTKKPTVQSPDQAKDLKGQQPDQAKHLDQIKLCVYAMHGLIDVRFHRFEHEVSAALSTSNFLADVSVLGVTTAATLASVDSAKILAAIAAGITGTRKSWDEDVLYSYSIQEILLQMQTDRALADTQIRARLAPGGKNPYENIYDASIDLYNYDIAGSWEHAMSSLQLNVAATTAACQARLRNQQMASAAGSQAIPAASSATDPCNSTQVQALISKDDIKAGAIFWTKDKDTIMIVDAGQSSGKPSYKTMQKDGTWSSDPASSDVDTLLPKLLFLLKPGSS